MKDTDYRKQEICKQKNVEMLFIFEQSKFKSIETVEKGVKIPSKYFTEAVPILDEVLMLYILEDQYCKHIETTDGQIVIPSRQYVRNLSNLNRTIEIICVEYDLRNVVQKEERDKIIGEAFKKQIGNVKKEDTLGVRYPSIADEWDTNNNYGISPYEIRYNSQFDANWIDRQTGKRWMTSVQNRTKNFKNN